MNRLTVALALALIVAGCGSTEHSAAPPSAQSAAPLPTMDQTTIHAFADLESKLPAQIAGRQMVRASYALDPGTEADTMTLALQRQGKDIATLQMAIAYPGDDTGDLTVLAYRYPGMTAADLLALLEPDDLGGTISPTTLGGRQVVEI